jgi:uncharacterized protein YceH (UPF0502 family)
MSRTRFGECDVCGTFIAIEGFVEKGAEKERGTLCPPCAREAGYRAAMAVHSLMGAVDSLCSIAAQDNGFDFLRQDMLDIEKSYNRLSFLISALKSEQPSHAL